MHKQIQTYYTSFQNFIFSILNALNYIIVRYKLHCTQSKAKTQTTLVIGTTINFTDMVITQQSKSSRKFTKYRLMCQVSYTIGFIGVMNVLVTNTSSLISDSAAHCFCNFNNSQYKNHIFLIATPKFFWHMILTT